MGYLLMPQSCPIQLLFDSRMESLRTYLLQQQHNVPHMMERRKASAIHRPASRLWQHLHKRPSRLETRSYRQCSGSGKHLYVCGRHHQFHTFGDGKYLHRSFEIRNRNRRGDSGGRDQTGVQTSVADISMSPFTGDGFRIGRVYGSDPLIVVVIGIAVYYRREEVIMKPATRNLLILGVCIVALGECWPL